MAPRKPTRHGLLLPTLTLCFTIRICSLATVFVSSRLQHGRQQQSLVARPFMGKGLAKMFGFEGPEDMAEKNLKTLLKQTKPQAQEQLEALQRARASSSAATSSLEESVKAFLKARDAALVSAEEGWNEEEALWDESLKKSSHVALGKAEEVKQNSKAVLTAMDELVKASDAVRSNALNRTAEAEAIVKDLEESQKEALQPQVKEVKGFEGKIQRLWALGKAEVTDAKNAVAKASEEAAATDESAILAELRERRAARAREEAGKAEAAAAAQRAKIAKIAKDEAENAEKAEGEATKESEDNGPIALFGALVLVAAIVALAVSSGKVESPSAVSSGKVESTSAVISKKVELPSAVSSGKVESPSAVSSGKVESTSAVISKKVELPSAVSSGKVELPSAVSSGKVELPSAVSSGKVESPSAVSSGKVALPSAKSSTSSANSAPAQIQKLS
eukprot:TRINITY_DN1545_c0_g1_i1.p1 TRINITY_DN1545_c0_g1~~TRINITY_DN1545_c0_g1_i1.p1  ORF type:complete len:448 (-),score=105.23 TRINITY_DN1545_c0_g1_i1:479-1822(-)